MNRIKLWHERVFTIISNQRAKELGLTFIRNIHGDEINHINCRSIWEDKRGRKYRVKNLNHNHNI